MSERDSHRQSHTAEEKMIADKIQKLSQLLELDEDSFAEQFADFHPIAQHKLESAGLEPLMAWKAALSLALKDSNLRNHHPQGELRKALARAFGWGCSTSGVEQAFSGIRALTNSKGSMTEIALGDEVFLLSTQHFSQAEDEELVRAAAVLWAKFFGPVKTTGSDSTMRSVAASRAWQKRRKDEVDRTLQATRS